MAMETIKVGNEYNVNQYEIWLDTDEDIKTLPTNVPIFSVAISVESGRVFIFNTEKQWKELGGKV